MPETDPVERYIHAKQAKDVEGALACFAPDAVVHDDGHAHEGVDAIRRWMEGVTTSFELRFEITSAERNGTASTTLVATSGNFPGSPITFRHDAEVVDGRIRSMTIAPA